MGNQIHGEYAQLFVTSWLDFLSQMAPGVGLLFRLVAIQALSEKFAQSKGDVVSSRLASDLEIAKRKRLVLKKRAMNLALFV